ncbi:hypothetical protein AGMMS49975_07300 [Clostridia bacterium]|nr:hypothetical protein AGMMS49975_07300 [Clostridia bacterium]
MKNKIAAAVLGLMFLFSGMAFYTGRLEFKDTPYIYQGLTLGSYPLLTGADGLNRKIADDLKYLLDEELIDGIDAKVEYEIEQDNYISAVTVHITAYPHSDSMKTEHKKTYYIDKRTKKEATEEDYKKDKAEELAKILDGLVPLASNLQKLGYTYTANAGAAKTFTWADGKIYVYDADKKLSVIETGSASYKDGGKSINLGVKAENKDGVTYVPASYFQIILNLSVEYYDGVTSFYEP